MVGVSTQKGNLDMDIHRGPLQGSQPCKGTCVTQWSSEPCHAGPPKTDGSQWRVLTKYGPLEEGMTNHSSILGARNPWIAWKGKKIWHRKMSPPGWKVSNMLLEKNWRTITNSSRKKEAAGLKRKWCSVVDVSGGENKVRCYKEKYCIRTWNVRSMNQDKLPSKRWQEWTLVS